MATSIAATKLADALTAGTIGLQDLSARKVGRFLGKTTSVIYHHWGCVDVLLFEVAQVGFVRLGERQAAAMVAGGLEQAAESFVRFGLEQPALYALMFERRYAWERLRKRGVLDSSTQGMSMWSGITALLEHQGSRDPTGDARVLYAALHGLVSLARSGRANIGDLSVSDSEMALRLARSVPRRLLSLEEG
jgi:hypothetical protein